MPNDLELSGFVWPVRVYYEDTDAGGVVYHGNYLKFFERARTERLRALGFEQDDLRVRDGIVFVVRSMEINFLKPARFNDALLVTAEIAELKRVSMTFQQRIFRAADPRETLCDARVRVACLAAENFQPCPIPDHLLQRIQDGA